MGVESGLEPGNRADIGMWSLLPGVQVCGDRAGDGLAHAGTTGPRPLTALTPVAASLSASIHVGPDAIWALACSGPDLWCYPALESLFRLRQLRSAYHLDVQGLCQASLTLP